MSLYSFVLYLKFTRKEIMVVSVRVHSFRGAFSKCNIQTIRNIYIQLVSEKDEEEVQHFTSHIESALQCSKRIDTSLSFHRLPHADTFDKPYAIYMFSANNHQAGRGIIIQWSIVCSTFKWVSVCSLELWCTYTHTRRS